VNRADAEGLPSGAILASLLQLWREDADGRKFSIVQVLSSARPRANNSSVDLPPAAASLPRQSAAFSSSSSFRPSHLKRV